MAGRRRTDGEALTEPPPISKGESAAIAAVALVFAALRVPLLTLPGVLLGWNSDAAIFGFMAKSIAAGRSFPIFFLGQSYMGPLTSWVTAAVAPLAGGVGPLALRIGASVEVLGGILFYWLALRRAFGPAIAVIVAAWLAAGPGWFLQFSSAPIGAEQMFLLSGALVWYAISHEMRTPREWVVFGLLSGFGWWINQGVVFVIGGAIATAVLRSGWWGAVRPHLHAGARLTLRHYALPGMLRLLLQAVSALLIADALAGLLVDFGVAVPALFLESPVAEPLFALAALHLILASVNRRGAIAWPPLRNAAAFAVGALGGYLPVIVGAFTGAYVHRYGFSAPPLSPGEVPAHVLAVAGDLRLFLGGDGARFVAFLVLASFVSALLTDRASVSALLALRHGAWGGRTLAGFTVLLAGTFYLVSERAHPGSMRYIVSALPFVYAFAAAQMLRIRYVGLVLAGAVAVGMLVPRIQQVRDIAAARSENYAGFAGGFDPRPALAAIRAGGYQVCYADYWVAYKLEWLGGGSVRFVPWRSYDRNPAASVRLDALPVRKCFVTNEGVVRPLGNEHREGATSAAARERLRRAGEESLASRPPL